MSMDNLSKLEYDAPHKSGLHRAEYTSNRGHNACWHLQSGLVCLKERTKSMQPGLLLIIQEQRQDERGVEVWVTVPSSTTYVPTWERDVMSIRLALQDVPTPVYVEGEEAWTVLPSDIIDQQTLLGQLSIPLRLAYHAAIRKAANKLRKALVKVVALDLTTKDSHMQGWASMWFLFIYATILEGARHHDV